MEDNRWVRCPNCGHKLFKVMSGNKELFLVEIKCHSCKWVGVVPKSKTIPDKKM